MFATCRVSYGHSPTGFLYMLCHRRMRLLLWPRWMNRRYPSRYTYLTLQRSSSIWSGRYLTSLQILSGFQKVTHLVMVFETSEQIAQFFASFPSLINLPCSIANCITDGATMMLQTPLSNGLKAITLRLYESNLFDGLLSLDSHLGVRTITCLRGTRRRLVNCLRR